MNITEWFDHHKTLLIVCGILLLGFIAGILALTNEEVYADARMEVEEPLESEEVQDTEEIKPSEQEEKKVIVIDIKGAVENPGVYTVEDTLRIHDIISLAGGLKQNADTRNINLSKKVQDEMVIYIYTTEELKEKMSCTIENEFDGEISSEINQKESVITKATETKKKVNINTATEEELITLPGIGSSLAQKIIEYRTKIKFQTIEDIKNVSGIKDSLFEKIKENITI